MIMLSLLIVTWVRGAVISDTCGYSIAIQSDGSILTAGYMAINDSMQLMIARYTSDGLVDTAYGNNGYSIFPINTGAQVFDMLLLADDEAVISGYGQPVVGTSYAVAQITTNGILDTSFNSSGMNTTFIGSGGMARAIAQVNNNYVLNGVTIINSVPTITLVRYTPIGALDTTFGSDGIVTTQIGTSCQGYSIAVQSDGQIVAGGLATVSGNNNFAVCRYNSADGSLDTTFNSNGTLPGTVTTAAGTISASYAITIQSDGKIVAAGSADGQFALVRYNSDSSLDTTFGSSGIVTTPIGSNAQINGITIDLNGQIVVAGFSDQFVALARYNASNGSLDTTFNSSGSLPGTTTSIIGVTAQASDIAITNNGQILVVGTSDNNTIIARYNAGGTLDTTFGPYSNGYINFPNNSSISTIKGINDRNIANMAGIQYQKLNLANQIVNGDISIDAAIDDTKLATIQTAGKIVNSATTATALNVTGAIVARDDLGDCTVNSLIADENLLFNANNTILNVIGTTQGSFIKTYAATGVTDSTNAAIINYSAAEFINSPQIFLTAFNDTPVSFAVNSVSNMTGAIISSSSGISFNYLAIGV